MPYAIDFSNYQNPSKTQLAQIDVDGKISRIIVGLKPDVQDYQARNLVDCISLGFDVQVYVTPFWGYGSIERLVQVLSFLEEVDPRKQDIPVVWIDVEVDMTNLIDIDRNHTILFESLRLIRLFGRTAGIYTSPYMWNLMMGNNYYFPLFANRDFLVWLASWTDKAWDLVTWDDLKGVIGLPAITPEMWQCNSGVSLYGLSCDVSVYP